MSRFEEEKPLVIFHSINGTMHCDDGMAAAWAVRQRFPDAEFVPGIYGTSPPDCTGRHVVLVDFSYPYQTLVRMSYQALSLLVIDHHRTAAVDLDKLPKTLIREDQRKDPWGSFRSELASFCQSQNMPVVGTVFDMNKSGGRLAWEFFHPDKTPPDLLLRIEDGDLWRWVYDDSRLVQATLRSYPQDFDTWDRLMARPIGELAQEGVAIRRFIDAKLRELLPNARMMLIDGHAVEAVACPKFLASELAGVLAERGKGPFGVTYEDGATQRTYSLRSRDDFDVSEIARKFGGGGHKNAAGFQVPLP